jgi:hypothetical protein
MRSIRLLLPLLLLTASTYSRTYAETPTAALPIREVTSFKDGHALVLRSGRPTATIAGTTASIEIGELPRAVLGTFWAQCDTSPGSGGAAVPSLRSVRVERRPVDVTRTATSIEDLLRANVGREIRFRAGTGPASEVLRSGTIRSVSERRAETAGETRPWQPVGGSWRGQTVAPVPPQPPEPMVLIDEQGDVTALAPSDLLELRLVGNTPVTSLGEPIEQERMTLDLALPAGQTIAADAMPGISLMYLQRGLRWIPSYRITMLTDSTLRVELQATLVNELADLDDVLVHLAIGVPSFAFASTPDPMSLRESLDELGLFFRQAGDGRTSFMLSNAIMSQSSRMGETRSQSSGGADAPADELGASERTEDLFVISLPGITLAKGARMVVPVTSYDVPFESVYRLDLIAAPPAPSLASFPVEVQRSIAQLLDRPVARHVLRLQNVHSKGYPTTTAPAMIVKDGRVLAQGMMTYAAAGASVDLEVGAAVDIAVKSEELESGRQEHVLLRDDLDLTRVDIRCVTTLTNRKNRPVRLEVRKYAFGLPDTVGQGGDSAAMNVFAADAAWSSALSSAGIAPWWQNYSWPSYWHRVNGAARFSWTLDLPAGQSATLDATWHYFWR